MNTPSGIRFEGAPPGFSPFPCHSTQDLFKSRTSTHESQDLKWNGSLSLHGSCSTCFNVFETIVSTTTPSNEKKIRSNKLNLRRQDLLIACQTLETNFWKSLRDTWCLLLDARCRLAAWCLNICQTPWFIRLQMFDKEFFLYGFLRLWRNSRSSKQPPMQVATFLWTRVGSYFAE